jgi:hypothetical protein
MNAQITRPARRVIACSIVVALAGFTQAAQAHEQCSLTNVAGTYGYSSSGAIVTPPVGPFTAIGRATLTNSGTFTGEQTTGIAGNFFEETINGDYVVNPDCTAAATAYIYRGSILVRTTTFNVVWDSNRREFRGMFLTPGTSISITGRRM